MTVLPIDVWDTGTFDQELRDELEIDAKVIRDFFVTSERQWIEREASDHTSPHPENPYSARFIGLTEKIMRLMECRTIRAWHYTRMTDSEVEKLLKDGIHLSTLDRIRERLQAQVVT